MKKLSYTIAKIKWKVFKSNREVVNDFFRKNGVLIGKNCKISCNILSPEPYLINIGDNVTISYDVLFITHDNSISKIDSSKSDIFGEIKIGNNCFIGANSTILYGVELADNIIVGAGSVVTKSFVESNIIIAGNPAKKITTWTEYYNKKSNLAINVTGVSNKEKKNLVLKSNIKVSKR